MQAPDRSAEIRALAELHPEAFGAPLETNDARRLVLLRDVIVPYLNTIDGGQWGLLAKQDQGGKNPVDIIVWRDTREHFDVLTGTGACWIAYGPVQNPAWVWQAVQAPTPAPPSPPPIPSPTPDQFAEMLTRLAMIEDHLAGLTANFNYILGQIDTVKRIGWPVYRGSYGIELRAQSPTPK